MNSIRRRRGAVLIIVLGVLVVLALLATTFATLQGVERSVSRNYLDEVRAVLLAQSGVDFAVEGVRKLAEQNLVPAGGVAPWKYWGDDADESGPGGGSLAVPLEEARNPSFAMENEIPQDPYNGTVTPRLVRIQGADRGFSGGMTSGQYGRNADLYTLKVSDASGKIFLNEGLDHVHGNDSTGSRNLRRILNQLGAVSTVNVPNLGNLVLANRPANGYQSVRELRIFLTDIQYRGVEDFLTAHAWVDRAVAHPVPCTQAHADSIRAEFAPLTDGFGIQFWRGDPTSLFRFGRGKDYLNRLFSFPPALMAYQNLAVFSSTQGNPFSGDSLQHAIYALDELNPQYIEIASRAPVNVNAASREVLIALLSDLRGVFVSERRRNNIETRYVGMYHYLLVKHTYSQENMPTPPPYNYPAVYNVPEGDEYGFLYETWPIVGPAGTAAGISAVEIAEHLVACREARATQGAATAFDYSAAAVPFRGPFRNWRQFNAFADHLVTIGVLEDPRGKAGGPPAVFFDHAPGPGAGTDYQGKITGNWPLVPSEPQRLAAGRAIADVLKANFNPNLHLNELNPDRTLFTQVDKTDLVVNSTEFVFAPTGYFDVESLGRVLRPTGGAIDSLFAPDNELVAEAKIRAGIRVFEMHRETTQRQFVENNPGGCTLYDNILGCLNGTNNARSIEVGPEPDNGAGPYENRWSGYLAWPTLGGGNYFDLWKDPGTVPVPTTAGSGITGSKIHTHLAWDFDAHHHADGDAKRKDMGSAVLDAATDKLYNYADPGETVPGPYDPTDNGGNYYRLARSFDLFPPAAGASFSYPTLTKRAPMDLRIDGGYIERHAGLAYWISPTSYVATSNLKKGAMSYWIKPSFFPERSGKPRLFMDMSRRGRAPDKRGTPWTNASFVHLWNAGHDTPWGGAPVAENQSTWTEYTGWRTNGFWGPVPCKPQSMIFGVGYGNYVGYSAWNGAGGEPANYYQYMESPSVNHLGHNHAAPAPSSPFQGHEWLHIALSWTKVPDDCNCPATEVPPKGINVYYWLNIPTWEPATYKVFVNGQILPGYLHVTYRFHKTGGERDTQYDPTTQYNGTTWHFGNPNGGDRNALRFGSPSVVYRGSLSSTSYAPFTTGDDFDNFTADSTMDEIFFWNHNASESTATYLWTLGRYYYPKSAAEAIFTSRQIVLTCHDDRNLAPLDPVPPPAASGSGAPGSASGTSSTTSGSPIRLLGMSWTWVSEGSETVGGAMVPTISDRGPAGVPLHPVVEAALADPVPSVAWASAPPAITSAVTDDGYSPLRLLNGLPVTVPSGDPVRYRIQIKLPDADPLNSVVTASPVVDDVTLYYTCGDAVFTYYYNDGCRF